MGRSKKGTKGKGEVCRVSARDPEEGPRERGWDSKGGKEGKEEVKGGKEGKEEGRDEGKGREGKEGEKA